MDNENRAEKLLSKIRLREFKEAFSIRALELAIDSYAKLEEPQIATTGEILERARVFRDFLLHEEWEECEQPPVTTMPGPPCNCEQCRELRATTMPKKPEQPD